MKNSYALVTGATSGIGLEISKYLAKKGYNLILVARTKDKLNYISKDLSQKYNVECDYFPSDLSEIKSPDDIYNFTKENHYNINISYNMFNHHL